MDAAVNPSRRSYRRARRAPERALLRPRLPAAAGAARDHRAICSPSAQTHGVMVQQPAVAGADRKRRGQRALSQADLPEAASGAEDGHDFPPPREYLGVYLERRRESGFQLYNTLGIASGDKAAYAQAGDGELQFLRRAACRHHPYRRAARRLRRGRLRRLCRQLHAGRPGARPRHHSAGGAGAAFRADPPPLQARRRPPRGLRHFVRIRRQCGHKVNSYRTSRAGIADTVTFVDE